MSLLSEMATYGGFVAGIPGLVRRRYALDEACRLVRQRLADRPRHLIASVARALESGPRSPYRALMHAAGCERGDVERLVADEGVEGALASMRGAGIYVTFEEFKGNRPIVRGSRTIETLPEDFDNPSLRRYYAATTGGSSGRPRRVLMDLDFLEARKPAHEVMMHAHGIASMPMAQWAEIPPGHGLEAALVQSTQNGNLERWFTPVWDGASGPGWRFRAATRVAVAVARHAGAAVPMPEHVPFDRAEVIVRWIEATLRAHGTCALRAHVSKALRVAVAATEMGVDLAGLTITSGGEPPTPAKVNRIAGAGARFIANYFFMEAGPIGFGCTHASDPSDQHFMKDHLALVSGPREIAGGPRVDAFYVTTLLPSAPKLMLNVELDDYGIVEQRACGCALGALGLDTHLRQVRSFSKLTGEGVTLIGSDMERILEEDLPSAFGGSALDYQLLEEEDDRGFTRLTLLVHPRLAVADEGAVVTAVLNALARRGGGADVSRGIWQQAGTLRVRREPPRANSRGKVWPLHVARGRTSADDGPGAGSATGGIRPTRRDGQETS